MVAWLPRRFAHPLSATTAIGLDSERRALYGLSRPSRVGRSPQTPASFVTAAGACRLSAPGPSGLKRSRAGETARLAPRVGRC